jgi:peptide/nickel transport system substrate-binding protein
LIAWLAVATAVLAVSGCSGADPEPAVAPGDAALRGGTLRVATGNGLNGLDPLNMTPGPALELYRCCLLRTLMSYPGVPTAEGGGTAQPDLAATTPAVSRDGLTWTFTLRRGLRYAPPHEDTLITSGDVVRSLERLAGAKHGAYLANFFRVIEGFAAFAAGRSDSISGLERPDEHILRVRLTKPAGDLGDLFALPFTAPIPAAAHARRAGGEYGRFLATSGPYMIESASDGGGAAWRMGGPPLRLVRNPSWRRDSDPLRPAYVDRIDVYVGDGGGDGARAARITLLHMNLARPPFDDLRVRRAMNLAVDREAVGAGAQTATHLVPDGLERDLLVSYDPYDIRGGPRIAAAREEMAQSRYDADGDGHCDARACRRVPFPVLTEGALFGKEISDVVTEAARAVGIELDVTLMRWDPWIEAIAPKRHPPLVIGGWFKDYHNASTFFVSQFHGARAGDSNLSLVGASSRTLARFGYRVRSVPSVDSKIEQCIPLVGADRRPAGRRPTSSSWKASSPRSHSSSGAAGGPSLDGSRACLLTNR